MPYISDLAIRELEVKGHVDLGDKRDFITKRGKYYRAFRKEARKLGAFISSVYPEATGMPFDLVILTKHNWKPPLL